MPETMKHKGRWIALAVVLAAAVLAGVRVYVTDTFPDGVTLNGISVSGMTAAGAKKAVDRSANKVKMSKDGKPAVSVRTAFTYDTERTIRIRLAAASLDPRAISGHGVSYRVPLKADGGTEASAEAIEKAFPRAAGTKQTKDAYIDLDTMKIVSEVTGDSLDYKALAKAVASQLERDPEKNEFSFKSSDYIAKPEVRASDLKDELKFDRKYLADGLTLKSDDGTKIHLTAKQLSKVILYSKDGPEYSSDGAYKVAKELSDDFRTDTHTVETEEGQKTLINYVIRQSVDTRKTGDSILEAAKEGKSGKIYLKAGEEDTNTRIEVSISSQKVYYVKDGKMQLETSVVTGSSSHPTPRGIFRLSYKERNVTLTGPNGDGTSYASKVSYWMPFNGGVGLHDAPWRSSFGGSIYVNGGSHGCVNMPVQAAKKLYNSVEAGTLVYVYD